MLGPTPKDLNNVQGMIWALVSVVTASVMTIAIRVLSESMDSRLIVFWRFAITMIGVAVVLLAIRSWRKKLKFSRPKEHLLRGVLVGVSTHLGFFAITQLPLATVSVLFFTAPIFATVLSVIIHGETIGPRRIGAIALGFLGAVLILRPGVQAIDWGVIAALVSSLTFAGALAMSRNLAQIDGPFSTFFSANLISLLITIPFVVPIYAVPSGTMLWFWIAVLVTLGFARQLADIRSYTLAEASVIAPISYLRLVLLGIAGYLLYAEVPDKYTLIGAAIIIAATLYIARREAMLKR